MNMDKQKTLNLYMDYIQAFENKDYDSIANVCRTPFFVSSPSGTIIFENREELIEGFSHKFLEPNFLRAAFRPNALPAPWHVEPKV